MNAMVESRLIRELRERNELEDAVEVVAELFTDLFVPLLHEALKESTVRAAIHNIATAAAKPAARTPATRTRGTRRA